MTRDDAQWVADIVRDAGGTVIGRTRLQKIAYLLEVAGFGGGFKFRYKHYGPYSEELASATSKADLLGLIREKEEPASWGGHFSTFTTQEGRTGEDPRFELLRAATHANAIQLELAATALFLARDGVEDPWQETARRKPEKAGVGLTGAKRLYDRLRQIGLPNAFPKID